MGNLNSRQHFADLYDRVTISQCRLAEAAVNDAFRKLTETPPTGDVHVWREKMYLNYALAYFHAVETVAGERWHVRGETIESQAERDDIHERALAYAQVASKPYCRSCGHDMEVILKQYLGRMDPKTNKPMEDMLFIFECKPCQKRLAQWEDGTEWEGARTACPKCGSMMTREDSRDGLVVTTDFTCSMCSHTYRETLELGKGTDDEESADLTFELDRRRFCFDDATGHKYLEKKANMDNIVAMAKEWNERGKDLGVYAATKQIKQLRVADLADTLGPTTEQAGYREFKLGEPEIGEVMLVPFTCLETKTHRGDYSAGSDLRKLITTTLEETNWRLARDTIRSRMGYLTGKLRAYESEADMVKLVEQRIKDGTLKLEPTPAPNEVAESASVPVSAGNGKSKHRVYVAGVIFNPKVRVLIPCRDDDPSVPEVIRNYVHEVRRP